jgi:hypothetical protein
MFPLRATHIEFQPAAGFVRIVICHSAAPAIRHCFRKVRHNVRSSATNSRGRKTGTVGRRLDGGGSALEDVAMNCCGLQVPQRLVAQTQAASS